MSYIHAGHLTINARYLVLAEDSEREPQPKTLPEGVLRITVDTGGASRTIDFRGDAASQARKQIDELPSPRSTRSVRMPLAGHPVPVDDEVRERHDMQSGL